MKKVLSAVLICFFTSANALDFDVGVSGGDRGVDGFYFSIGNYYNVPEREIVVVEHSISREDVNVAYFLARRAHRDVRFITDLRLSGRSWWDISLRLGLDPRTIYVVDTYNDYGPPYGKAYGYYKDKHHRLDDRQIAELVNVRFLSEYHGISSDEVIVRRRKGSDFYHDNDEYRERKHKTEKNKTERYERDREREEYRDGRERHEKNRYENEKREKREIREKRNNENSRGRER